MNEERRSARELGLRVLAAREAAGKSQADVANEMTAAGLGWHQTTVAKTESGQREPRYSELFPLAQALEVTAAELLRLPQRYETRAIGEQLLRTRDLHNDRMGVLAALSQTDAYIDLLSAERSHLRERRRDIDRSIKQAQREIRELARDPEHILPKHNY